MAVVDVTHAGHELGQLDAVRSAQAVLLLRDGQGLVGSWSEEYDGTPEGCAVVAGVEVAVGALTGIWVIRSRSYSNCSVSYQSPR